MGLMTLETETEYFNRNRARWIEEGHEGKWVVVCAEEVLGFFPTLEDGYEAGVNKFDAGNFLLKQVTPEDKVETIRRVHWGAGGRKATI